MSSPADVASTLIPNTVIEGSTGWTRRVGIMPPTPDKVVSFYDSGGQNPNPKWLLDYPSIQVRVRGNVNDYAGAYAKCREVRDVLLGFESQTVGSDRWDSITGQGDIGFMGYDDKERPEFSMNFRLIIEPATNSLTNREPL